MKIALLIKEKDELKAKNISLQNDKEKLNSKLMEKEKLVQHYYEEYERLLHLIKNANRQNYGAKSEKYKDLENPEQLKLFELTEEATVTEEPESKTETITYKRKKSNRKEQHKNLPRKEVIIPVSEKERTCTCGCEKQFVRYESKEKIHYQPAVLEIIEEKREILACPKGCAGSLAIAELPKVALPKICATEELLSHIAVSKVLDRQPLYHLEQQFKTRNQVNISRQTMARWLEEMSQVFQPILNQMKEKLLSYEIVSMDATSFQVLKEPGRKATTKSYAYCMRGGPPGEEVVLYEYNAIDHKQFLSEYWEGYRGILQVDADPFFEDLPKDNLKQLSYCNAHARRRFEQITKTAKRPGLAKEAMDYYRKIYKVEREAKELKLSSEGRRELRQEKTKPIMEKLRAWLTEHKDKTLPKSPLGQAIAYALKHWTGLNKFLDDGRLEADNNLTEQQIKYFVIGRKNFLFADTVAGAEGLMNHYGLLLTAKKHGLNPATYYTHLLKQIPHCQSFTDYEKLLPWNVKLY